MAVYKSFLYERDKEQELFQCSFQKHFTLVYGCKSLLVNIDELKG